MQTNLGIIHKLTRIVVFLIILASAVGVGVWYWPVIQRNEGMRKRILHLEKQIREEDEKGKKTKAALDAVSRDAKVVERLARERLNLAKPGETVIRFEAVPGPPDN